MNAKFHFYVYVPEVAREKVKTAIFEAGAGKIDTYSCCAWQTKGNGQFKPESGSHPYVGSTSRIESVVEYKVETICSFEKLPAVVAAMKSAHPYETPAYGCIQLYEI